MARIFMYKYLGDEQPKTVMEDDPDERAPIPEKGEIIVRNGNIWRVLSVELAERMGPAQSSRCSLEVRVCMARIRSGPDYSVH